MRAARHTLLVVAALLACFPLSACAGEAQFHHGVIGVPLSDRVGEYSTWSPDGRWIAEPARVGIRLRNVETGKERELKAPAYQGFPERPGRLEWSGDGKTIRYATSIPRPENGNASWLTEVPLDGSGYRHQTVGVRAQQTGWASDGYPFAFATGAYALDLEKGPIGPKPSIYVVDDFGATPRRVAFIPHPKREEEIEDAVVSPDGSLIAYKRWGVHHNVNVWTVRSDGSDPAPIVSGLTSAETLAWSPSGKTLALGAFDPKGDRRQHVYVVPATGGKLRQVVDEEILDGPAWSPDGRWLAYSTYDGKVWRVHPNGRGRQLISEVPGEEVKSLIWSPDGHHLAYRAEPPPPFD